MKKLLMKHFMGLFLAVVLTVTALPVANVSAAGIQPVECVTHTGSNVNVQNYIRWTETIKSYLVPNADGTFMRVQAGGDITGILVEYYNADYELTGRKTITDELPIFGGFYVTDDAYYVVTGQENWEEDSTKEVIRVTKYDKNWKKIRAAGLKACNTTIPFDAGSLRMDMCGKYLMVRTSHQMNQETDGLRHQANMTFEVDTETMTVSDVYYQISDYKDGYISHSFNQFIKMDGGQIVALDHGDSYPRALALTLYNTDASTGKFSPLNLDSSKKCTMIEVMQFGGTSGTNATGASAGGFELTESSYLIAGNTADQVDLTGKTRNIFVASVDKVTHKVTTNWLTNYAEGDGTVSTPHMVRITDNRFLVLWYRDNEVYYTEVDGNGQQLKDIVKQKGQLSDCVPVVVGDKVLWYTWDNNILTFYELGLEDGSFRKVEKNTDHDYRFTGIVDNDEETTLICNKCDHHKRTGVITSFEVNWKTETSNGLVSYYDEMQDVGNWVDIWVGMKGFTSPIKDKDYNMVIESSDPSVISVNENKDYNGRLIMKNPGKAVITIYPKLNPNLKQEFPFTVMGPLEVNSFEATPGAFGSPVTLSASAKGGNEVYLYRYCVTAATGKETIIRDFSLEPTCVWTPNLTGAVTLTVYIKDTNGNRVDTTIDNYVVEKGEASSLDEKIFEYSAGVQSANQTFDMAALLPKNRGTTNYTVETIEDSSTILSNVSVNNAGILTYDVAGTTSIGDTASITIKAESENYKPWSQQISIKIAEKMYLSTLPQASAITYGDTLAKSTLTGGVVKRGTNVVEGTFSWKNPSIRPQVKDSQTTEYDIVFTPKNMSQQSITAKIKLTVSPGVAPNAPSGELLAPYSADILGKVSLPAGWLWETPGDMVLNPGIPELVAAVYYDRDNYTNFRVWLRVKRDVCHHTGGRASCRKEAICSICNQEYGGYNLRVHLTTKRTLVRQATCTSEGYTGDLVCVDCKNTSVFGKVIPALGHNLGSPVVDRASTCTAAGIKSRHCSRCGARSEITLIPAKGHQYGNWTVKEKATALREGKETAICSVCHNSGTRTISKLETFIKVNARTIPLKVKQKTTAVKVSMQKGDKITSWKSSAPKVAFVDQKGKITGKKPGTARVLITLASGEKAGFVVKVQKSSVKTTKISLNKRAVSLRKGKTFTLRTSLTPITSVEKVKYSTSNKKVATVSSKGVIKARKNGKATITVKAGKKKATCRVVVK